MKRLSLALILLTGLVACTPGTQPTVERNGDTVTARVNVEQPLYLASLILSHDTGEPLTREHVSDPRCVEGVVDGLALYMACDLGTVSPGQGVKVVARTTLPVTCLAGGYTDKNALSYKVVPCKVAE